MGSWTDYLLVAEYTPATPNKDELLGGREGPPEGSTARVSKGALLELSIWANDFMPTRSRLVGWQISGMRSEGVREW